MNNRKVPTLAAAATTDQVGDHKAEEVTAQAQGQTVKAAAAQQAAARQAAALQMTAHEVAVRRGALSAALAHVQLAPALLRGLLVDQAQIGDRPKSESRVNRRIGKGNSSRSFAS